MLAMLFEMTSTRICWAAIPDAAICNDFIGVSYTC